MGIFDGGEQSTAHSKQSSTYNTNMSFVAEQLLLRDYRNRSVSNKRTDIQEAIPAKTDKTTYSQYMTQHKNIYIKANLSV